MLRRANSSSVKIAFEESERALPIAAIVPLKQIAPSFKKSTRYLKIAASIREVGIVEPPVVTPDRTEKGKYLLLDGHLRVAILKDMGETEIICLIATDDEAFTYNKRVNRIATLQEYRMLFKALEQGVSPERLARALNIDVESLKRKRHLLVGICAEVAEILKDKHVAVQTFYILKQMKPLRQIEAAELMVAMNKYTVGYAKLLLAATPQAQLVESLKPKRVKGLSTEQVVLIEQESFSLEREFILAEKSYGIDHLDLVLANGYLARLLGNARVVRFLDRFYPEIAVEFRKLAALESLSA